MYVIRSQFDVVTFNSFSRKTYRFNNRGSRDDIYDNVAREQWINNEEHDTQPIYLILSRHLCRVFLFAVIPIN